MTKPTQPQIEAAYRIWHWLKRNANAERNNDKRAAFIEAANAALTIIEEAKAALTAAAQVVDPDKASDQQRLFHYETAWEKMKADTIERCAQMIEDWVKNKPDEPIYDLIQRIRAKKNPPPSSVNMWDDMKP